MIYRQMYDCRLGTRAEGESWRVRHPDEPRKLEVSWLGEFTDSLEPETHSRVRPPRQEKKKRFEKIENKKTNKKK